MNKKYDFKYRLKIFQALFDVIQLVLPKNYLSNQIRLVVVWNQGPKHFQKPSSIGNITSSGIIKTISGTLKTKIKSYGKYYITLSN